MKQNSIFDVTFPVYGITSEGTIFDEYNVTYIETSNNTYILDNKNLPGDTIGKRRARIRASSLYILRRTILNITQLIHSKYKVFIDNNGIVFKYKKTVFVPLKYYKVKDIKRIKDSCVIILRNIDYTLKYNCRLAYSIKYVGILKTKMGNILYELSAERKDDTKRKI